MDSKLLTESGWKAVALKFKVKDKDLQRALSVYEMIDDDEYEDRLKEITNIGRLAAALKKDEEITPLPAVVKYLAELLRAAESERKQVEAAAAKARAEAKKRQAQEKQDGDEEEEEEEDNGDYPVRLIAAFQKLKSAKDLSYEFIVCDAKPHCGLTVAKRITPKHKEELTKVTGGSKRFLRVGRCHFADGRFNFTMEQPVTGLARKLQDSIKNFTSKKLPIKVGTESAEADDEQPTSGQASAGAAAKAGQPKRLAKAPGIWHQTQQAMKTSVGQLKNVVRKEFAQEGADLVAEIEQNMKKIDQIFETLDHKLAESLAKAHATENAAGRAAELQNARAILVNHLKYVKSEEKLFAHIDENPWGIKTNLKQVLADCLKQMAQAIS